MRFNLNLKKFQRFCLLLICLVVLIFQSDIPNLKALTMDNYQSQMVIEELRLKVPADVKSAWLNAEKEIWEPWLSSQDGFLGRQLFWDKEKAEALILVNWKSKKLWQLFYLCLFYSNFHQLLDILLLHRIVHRHTNLKDF